MSVLSVFGTSTQSLCLGTLLWSSLLKVAADARNVKFLENLRQTSVFGRYIDYGNESNVSLSFDDCL